MPAEDILKAMTVSPQTSPTAAQKPEPTSTVITFQNTGFAAAILIAPIAFTVGGFLDPVVHVTNGAANVAANATANPFTNGVHLSAFVLDSFL